MRITVDEDLSWSGKRVIAEPFDVNLEFEIAANPRSGNVVLEGDEGPVFGIFFEQETEGVLTVAVPLYRDENGIVRGFLHRARIEDDRTVLDFEYADGAQAEIVSPEGGMIAYFVLLLD